MTNKESGKNNLNTESISMDYANNCRYLRVGCVPRTITNWCVERTLRAVLLFVAQIGISRDMSPCDMVDMTSNTDRKK